MVVGLIDADSIIYKAGCANETRWYVIHDGDKEVHRCNYKAEADAYCAGNPELTVTKEKEAGSVSISLSNAKNCLESILDKYKCDDYRVFIKGDGNNYRKGLYPKYKLQRDPLAAPLHEKEIREYLVRTWRAELVDGEEADDRVSYIQCSDLSKYCIIGVDKDLWNTPGEHYNFDTQRAEYVDHATANRNFWKQMLTGDSTDNIPGLPGVGPKKAEIVLSRPNHAAQVLQEYRVQKQSLSYLTLMGRLLWIRRAPGEFWDMQLMRNYEVPK